MPFQVQNSNTTQNLETQNEKIVADYSDGRENIPYAQVIVSRYEPPYYKKGLDEQNTKQPQKLKSLTKKTLANT